MFSGKGILHIIPWENRLESERVKKVNDSYSQLSCDLKILYVVKDEYSGSKDKIS